MRFLFVAYAFFSSAGSLLRSRGTWITEDGVNWQSENDGSWETQQ